jgi:hypothetical protein
MSEALALRAINCTVAGKYSMVQRSSALRINGARCAGPKTGDAGWQGCARSLKPFEKLLNTFRLARDCPHALDGFQARLAAKVTLHNFCLWLNRQLRREPLAFAELLDW